MIWHLFLGELSQIENLSEIKPPLRLALSHNQKIFYMASTVKLTCIIFDSLCCEKQGLCQKNGSQLIFKSQQYISCVHNSGSTFDGKLWTMYLLLRDNSCQYVMYVINFDPPEKKIHITELLISYVIDRMSIFTTMVSYDWLILAAQYSWEFITLFSKNIKNISIFLDTLY